MARGLSVWTFAGVAVLSAPARGQGHGPALHRRAPDPARIEVPAGGVSLPMADVGGRPVVEARINGKGPYRFILDTGASITVVEEALRAELSLPTPAGVRAASPQGGPERTIVTIDEIRIGEAVLGGVMAAVMPRGLLTGDDAPRGVL